MRYHVFIEGPRDATAAGMELLAAALARLYGAPPAEVLQRVKQGRFCARSALDLAPARRMAEELEALGAATSVVPDLGRGEPRYESGLAAAFAGSSLREDLGLDLGALGSTAVPELDTGWTLAHVDGSTDPSMPTSPVPDAGSRRAARADDTESVARVEPPRVAAPVAPAQARFEGAPPEQPAPDPFRPPDVHRPLPRLATLAMRPFAADSAPASVPAQATAAPAATGSSLLRPTLGSRTRDAIGESTRGRLVAGLLLAFAVGFVPAQLYASSRGASAYDDARAELVAEYRAADTPDRWRTLAAARDDAAALLEARRTRIAVSACLLWAVVGGAIGFAWFRLVRDPSQPRPA